MMGNEQSLEERIKEANDNFTASQKVIARYFLANESSVFVMTASEVAEKIGVSESTIVRFAKAIGFESYTQMQKTFQKQYVKSISFSERLKQNQVIGESQIFYETLLKSEADAIYNIIGPDFFDTLDKAAQMIENANRIFVAGSRGSAAAAVHISFNLNYMKSNVISLVSDFGEWQDRMLDCGEEDLVIGVCMPNYTKRTLDIMAFGRSRGASVLTLTDTLVSPACKEADLSICHRQAFLWSPSISIAIANAILQKVAQSGKKEILERMESIERVLNSRNPYMVPEKS